MTPQNSEFSVEEFRERFLQLTPVQRLCVRKRLVEGALQDKISDELGFTGQARVSDTLKNAYAKLGMLRPGKSYDPVTQDRWNKQVAVLIAAIKLTDLTPEEERILDTVRQRKAQGVQGELTAAEYGEQPASAQSEPPVPPPSEPSQPEPDNPPSDTAPSTEPEPVNTEPSQPAPDTTSTQSTSSSKLTQTEPETEPIPEPKQPEPINQNEPPSPIVDVIRTKQAAGEVGQGRINVDRRRLLLLVGAAVLIAFGSFLLGRLTPNQPSPMVANLPPEPTQTPIIITATPRPTLAFRPTRVRTATATRPTPTPQPTPTVVTATPTPELQTPTPTVPPTATPQPVQIGSLLVPFEDTFEQTWRPEWDASGGRLSVVNGKLTSAATAPFVLWLGDEQLTDYTVEFDYEAGWGIDLYVGPYFRWIDRFGNTTNGYSPRHWQERQPNTNEWTKISPDFFHLNNGRYKLVVKGDLYTLSINNGEEIKYTLGGVRQKGPIGIGLQQNTFIDNVKLTVP